MTQQEYEQKKQECWDRCVEDVGIIGYTQKLAHDYAFDRAYALGKQTEIITQEEIEKASVEYADKTAKQYEVCNSEFVQEIMVAFEQGANYALGKQEKYAEKKTSALTDKEVYALESAISELESLIEGLLTRITTRNRNPLSMRSNA